MDAVTLLAGDSRAIEGQGTTEAEWLGWSGMARLQIISASALVPAGARAIVVAPHPDDEVLAVGGLLAQLARTGARLTIVAVTDGTASHPGSSEWPVRRLVSERPLESRAALQHLGIEVEPVRLRLQDGDVKATRGVLVDQLASLLEPDDVVFTTWRGDGHPDHDATGIACAEAARRAGARLVEIPVWAWHWAEPGDARLPWDRARRIALDDDAVQRKQVAVRCFTSQLTADPSTGVGPILRGTTVARAARRFEVVFV